MERFSKSVIKGVAFLALAVVTISLISIFFVQSWRYTEAGKVPPKTAVLLHAVNNRLLPEGKLEAPALLAVKAPPTIEHHRVTIPTRDGGDIPATVYQPIAAGPHPIIVYYHGGAFLEGYGDLDTHDNIIRSLAARTGAIVVAPAYRLAPTYAFPTAVNDSYDALTWVYENADVLDGDGDRLAVAGDSAGGNLAAAVAIMSGEEGGPALSGQALLYPLATFEDAEFPSRDMYASGFYFLSRAVMEMAQQSYAPNEADWASPYTSPLNAEDVSMMPSTLVITGEFDPLRDEGEALAKRLYNEGIYVQAQRFNGVMHGFISFYEVMERGDKGLHSAAAFLKEALNEKLPEPQNSQPFAVEVIDGRDSWRDEAEAYVIGVYVLFKQMIQAFQ
ncbi:lipase/esterase [Shouchella clausii]|uniref:alpha/beta hydrolase n=1 Tax=Shouchella tritolerans TaxID=2979466 RepID=UPI000788AB7E|nr:alpha/beta hydrolase [Shouchella tritolerans]GIN11086.1 lipase/esterase [Shouchella clausii]